MSTFERVTTDRLYQEIDAAANLAAPLFNLYGWTYGEDHVPTHGELVDCITRIAESALNYFYQSEEEFREAQTSSGRFTVWVKEFEDEVSVRISLELGGHEWYKA
jgi:hypothetical protein